jgi:hypothetical protein
MIKNWQPGEVFPRDYLRTLRAVHAFSRSEAEYSGNLAEWVNGAGQNPRTKQKSIGEKRSSRRDCAVFLDLSCGGKAAHAR